MASAIISALHLNNNAQASMREWLSPVMKDHWLWVDRWLKAPLDKAINYNSWTLQLAAERPAVFALGLLACIYVIGLLCLVALIKILSLVGGRSMRCRGFPANHKKLD